MTRDRERLWRAFNPPPRHYDVRRTAAFQLTQASHALRRLLVEDRFELGVYEGRDLVLLEIARLDGKATAKHLVESLGLRKGTISTILRRSEEAGYVTRVRHPSDKRIWLLELTPTGRSSARMAAEMWRDADVVLAKSLRAGELEGFRDLARKASRAWSAAARSSAALRGAGSDR